MGSKDWYDKDYYKILGVPKDAKPEQIKKAFRKIARQNHPDAHPGDAKAEQRFKEASEAHDVLSDPDSRREYDQQRSLFGFAGGAGGAGGFNFNRGGGPGFDQTVFRNVQDANLGDIFGNLFSQASTAPKRSRRGADIEGEVTIGFNEAIEGTTVGVQLVAEDACTACRGTGAKTGTAPRVCPTCQGSGMQQTTSSGVFQMAEPCRDCRGRGLVLDDPCQVCGGSGRAQSRRTMQVRIPAGVTDGQKIVVKGKGGAGERGGKAGDLYVVVHVRPHPIFSRAGKDITVTVPVTFTEAALGAEIEVPSLGAKTVKLRIPAGTPNGRTLRVRGHGVPGANRGDLLVTIEVQVPDQLTESARQALRDYAQIANQPNPRTSILGQNR